MVYLIYGQDLAKLNYYLDKIKLENANSEKITITSSFDENSIVSNLYSPPMLTKRRLVILENSTYLSKINFAKINNNVDIVIVQSESYRPKLPQLPEVRLIEAKKTPLIFKFLDDLISGSQRENLAKLFRVIKTEETIFIFHQLISHFRRLLLAKENIIGEGEKLADWQKEKYRRLADRVSSNKLKIAYKLLLATEIEVKTGRKELKDTLPLLVLKLTQVFRTS